MPFSPTHPPPLPEDTTLHIQLSKAEEAAPWASALAGHELDSLTLREDQKALLLERFQTEVCVCVAVCVWGGDCLSEACARSLG
jgi:hypothetical protein